MAAVKGLGNWNGLNTSLLVQFVGDNASLGKEKKPHEQKSSGKKLGVVNLFSGYNDCRVGV